MIIIRQGVLCLKSYFIYTYLYLFDAGIDNARYATKLEKSCFRCKKNTWHVESNYILQPPKNFIIVVIRFRYINNNFIKREIYHTYGYDCCAWSPSIQPAGYHRSSRTIYVFWPFYCLYQLLHKNILLQRQQNYGF